MSKPDALALEGVSARLGEAALDPSLWPELMDGICRAIGAEGAGLLQSDVRTPDVPFTDSVKDLFAVYFREGWHERDLRARTVPLLLAGVPVVTDQDVSTPDEMRSHVYYNDFINRVGLHWWAGVGFRAGSALWALSLQRTGRQGPFEEREKRLLAPLVKPLTQVATLSNAVGRASLLGCTNALAAVRHPAVAIDQIGTILEANPAMGTVYGEELRIRNNRLVLKDQAANVAIEQLIRRIGASADQSAVPGAEPILIRRAEKPPVILRTLPVPPAARSPFLGACAIFTFTSLETKPQPDAALLAQAFGLTPAETRLAAMLADGSSLEIAADKLSIARETARNQLKSVFAKTGTHRQSQLVALLARL
jgi:DNA-binding CsgD family transcriptional regulator